MGSIGPWQVLLIAVIIVLLFGASRLADIGKGLAEGIRNFKKGVSDDEADRPPSDESSPKQKSKSGQDS